MPCNFTGIIHFQLPETVVCFPRHAPQSMHLSWGFLSFHLFPEICPRLSAAQVGGMGVIGRITPLITWTRNVVVVLQLFFFRPLSPTSPPALWLHNYPNLSISRRRNSLKYANMSRASGGDWRAQLHRQKFTKVCAFFFFFIFIPRCLNWRQLWWPDSSEIWRTKNALCSMLSLDIHWNFWSVLSTDLRWVLGKLCENLQ